MWKIPTVWVRDPENPKLTLPQVNEECRWVLDGEGVPTIKYDGSACAMLDGVLYRRHQHQAGRGDPPRHWRHWTLNPEQRSGHGWLPCGVQFPADRFHIQAVHRLWQETVGPIPDGTYELVGPKVQGNPYGLDGHRMWKHGEQFPHEICPPPRGHAGLAEWFANETFRCEGVVWHHPDGRMAKAKARDFGVVWPGRRV